MESAWPEHGFGFREILCEKLELWVLNLRTRIMTEKNTKNETDNNFKPGIIGIDLGTTNSLISFIKNKSPRIIPNERGSRTTPSVVSIKSDGKVIIGEMARNQAVLNAVHTVANAKLSMGSGDTYNLNNREYLPEEVSGLILAHLKQNAEQYLGCDLNEAVITVPAYFDDNQRRATMQAAAMAGIQVKKLLNEPTAAALAYGLSKDRPDSNMLVVDLGGGTFDITLMEYKDNVFKVKAVGGSTSIGGINFDKKIINHILEDFQDLHSCDLSKDNVAFQQLVIQSEKAKIDLSSAFETTIMIPYITITDKGPLHLNTTLDRKIFEELITPVLNEIKGIILSTFQKCTLDHEWVDTVILVGGSTRIPAIERVIVDIIDPAGTKSKKESLIKKAINQDEAVARGAAVMAGILNGDLTDIEFHDITSHDLGILNHEGAFETLIKAGSVFPMETSHLFSTVNDNQEEVVIQVMQNRSTNENPDLVKLGDFNLTIDKGQKKGVPNIDVTFAINLNAILTVSAVDLDTQKNAEIQINYEFGKQII